MRHQINAIFHQSGDVWVASAVEIAGAFAHGYTIDEARENLIGAVKDLLYAQKQVLNTKMRRGRHTHEVLSLDLDLD